MRYFFLFFWLFKLVGFSNEPENMILTNLIQSLEKKRIIHFDQNGKILTDIGLFDSKFKNLVEFIQSLNFDSLKFEQQEMDLFENRWYTYEDFRVYRSATKRIYRIQSSDVDVIFNYLGEEIKVIKFIGGKERTAFIFKIKTNHYFDSKINLNNYEMHQGFLQKLKAILHQFNIELVTDKKYLGILEKLKAIPSPQENITISSYVNKSLKGSGYGAFFMTAERKVYIVKEGNNDKINTYKKHPFLLYGEPLKTSR